jgi:hypothetical protein
VLNILGLSRVRERMNTFFTDSPPFCISPVLPIGTYILTIVSFLPFVLLVGKFAMCVG